MRKLALLLLLLPSAVPAADCEYSYIAGGNGYSCAVAIPEKTLDCWGYVDPLASPGPYPGVAATAVSLGYGVGCLVRDADDLLDCWGDEFDSDCGDAVWDEGDEPAGTFLDVGVEWVEACALATDGSIDCFGRTPPDLCFGELAGAEPAGTGHTVLTVGSFSACAITGAGALACWGSIEDNYGPAPAGTFTDVACIYDTCCALNTAGGIECWGDDFYNQVTDAPAATNFIRLSDSGFEAQHFCAVDVSNNAECWGYDDENGVSGLPASTFERINTNSWFSCGVTTDDHVECWGNDLATGAVDDAPTVDACSASSVIVIIFGGM